MRSKSMYTYRFLLPGGIIYFGLFLLPTMVSFFFSLTRWDLKNFSFIGLDNFKQFFTESSLNIGFRNTLVYAISTCLLKVVLGLLIGMLLCTNIKTRGFLRSIIFFPNLISVIAIGTMFVSLMHPSKGLINQTLASIGIKGPEWLGVKMALSSVILADVWRGVGFATIIYIAGIMSIPQQYYEALAIDGGNAWNKFRHITLPLSRPATNSVIILSFIGGLRSFDLVWSMTKGGPGFTTDLIASIIYKQYQGGFYGLATAGNVILFLFVSILAFPLYMLLNKSEVDL